MNTAALALRNLTRNRRRSLATVLAIVVGLSAILLFGGYSRNAVLAMETGYVQLHGHLQIQRKGYFLYGGDNPAAYGIADYERIVELARRDPVLAPMLNVATPKLQLGGIAGNYAAGVTKNVVASGVIAEDQNRMRRWDDYGAVSYSPRIALAGTAPDAVLVGTGVARMLQLCEPLKVGNCPPPPSRGRTGAATPPDIANLSAQQEGSPAHVQSTRIEMLAASARGAPNVAALNVVKAENWGLKEFDDMVVVMHLAQAQRLVFGSAPPQATAIQLQLRHTHQLEAARARLLQLLALVPDGRQLDVLDFSTLAPIYPQTIEFFDSVFGFIAILIGAIVLFTVGNTMSAAVMERTTEIGTLRAIGLRRRGIRALFAGEAVLLGLIGVGAGVAVALAVAWAINRGGFTWMPPGYVYAYPLHVRVWGDPGLILRCAAGVMVVALLSAWWPARRGARMNIVDALRHA